MSADEMNVVEVDEHADSIFGTLESVGSVEITAEEHEASVGASETGSDTPLFDHPPPGEVELAQKRRNRFLALIALLAIVGVAVGVGVYFGVNDNNSRGNVSAIEGGDSASPVTTVPDSASPVTTVPATISPESFAPTVATGAPLASETPAPVVPTTPAPVTSAPNSPTADSPSSPVTVPSAPVAPPTSAPVVVSTPAPVTNAPISEAPVVPPTLAPVVRSTPAPVVPVAVVDPTEAPVTAAPVAFVPTTSNPVASTTASPVVADTAAPIVTSAPVVPTTSAPVVPTTSAPVAPSTPKPTFSRPTIPTPPPQVTGRTCPNPQSVQDLPGVVPCRRDEDCIGYKPEFGNACCRHPLCICDNLTPIRETDPNFQCVNFFFDQAP